MNRVIEVDGTGGDGAMVFWDAGPVKASVLKDALDGAGLGGFYPSTSRQQWAIKEVLSDFCSASNLKLKQHGNPVKISPLRTDVRGVEAVRQTKGESHNQHDFLLSITVNDHGDVRIAEINKDCFSMLVGRYHLVEQAMTNSYRAKMEIMPTTMVSTCINNVLGSMGGTLCKQDGGLWFLPGDQIGFFEALAAEIMQGSSQLVVSSIKFPLKPTESSYRMVLASIRREALAVTKTMNDALADLAGSELRNDGISTRLRVLSELKNKVKLYEDLLGVTMTDVHQAVDDSANAVTTHNVLAACV